MQAWLCNLKDTTAAAVSDWNWKVIFLYLLVIGIFIIVAYQIYYNYILPRLDPDFVPNKEFLYENRPSGKPYPDHGGKGGGQGKDCKGGDCAELMFFCVKWCPHCKRADPEWQKIVKKFSGTKIGGKNIYFTKVDCETDEALADEYKITGYPTIKLITNDQIIEYNAKPIAATLEEFLHTTLGETKFG